MVSKQSESKSESGQRANMEYDLRVLLYVPNIVGYIRLLLLLMSWIFYYSRPTPSISLLVISISLDAFDGYIARRLKQCSAFGAWFDIVIDNLSRGMLWCRLYHFGFLVTALEWLTFVCTHTLGAAWKSKFVETPWWVKGVMAKNFKTWLGIIAITGLQVLPIWLYAHYHGVLDLLHIPYLLQYLGIALLAAGRALCMTVELRVVSTGCGKRCDGAVLVRSGDRGPAYMANEPSG